MPKFQTIITGITQNPDGSLTFSTSGTFKGDVTASSLILPSSTGVVNQIKFVNEINHMVSSLTSFPTGEGNIAAMEAQDGGGNSSNSSYFSCSTSNTNDQGNVSRIRVGRQNVTLPARSRTLLDGAGASDFLQTATTRKLTVNVGGGVVSWAATGIMSDVASIAHGLGTTPIAVLLTDLMGGAYPYVFSVAGKFFTVFQVQGAYPNLASSPAGTSRGFNWLAIG